MKKKLFNIHKLIGINVILFFFLSLFFGILTIFKPYINLWEDQKKHISHIKIEDINLEKCLKQVTKRKYFGEDGKIIRNDIIKLSFPAMEMKANNLIRIDNRSNFYLDPQTCKKIKPKAFTISHFFEKIHTGAIFNSIVFKILFGFMSVAVVFLSLSGLFMIIKNKYRNSVKSTKSHYAKYHRLLLLYTLPLVLMFGLTGALFNLGVYSSPLITSHLTNGDTANILAVDRNILVDPDLEAPKPTQKTNNIPLNELYKKAKNEFKDISFYSMQVYNYKDINAKVKFIGFEPNNYFISSVTNESYIVLDANNGQILDKKTADEGTFTEKTLDAIFYLHYLRTFEDIPRILFAFISMSMLVGLVYAMTLWLKRTQADKFSYKVLKPLSLSIMLGSLIAASMLFASNWIIPKGYFSFVLFDKFLFTQEVLFYLVYLAVFIYIIIKKDTLIIIKNSFYLSSFLLFIAVLAHTINSEFNIFNTYEKAMYEIFFTDIALTITAVSLFFFAKKIPKEYIDFN